MNESNTPSLHLKFRIAMAGLLLMGTAMVAQVATITSNVRVVNVLATVRDKHGNIINTLTQEDFVLNEDGRPQTIKYFTRQTDMPLTLGLLVDTSLSQLRVLDDERTASARFTDDVLRADKDSAFLIQFAGDVELLQDITQSPQQIREAIDRVDSPSMHDRTSSSGGGGYPGGGYPGGGHGRRRGGAGAGTALYDSIYLASNEMMQKQKGRKAIIVLTDGVDHGSKESLDEAIESAQRANTMVYAIYFEGNEGGGGGWGRPGGGGHRGGWPGGGGWPGVGDSSDGKKVLDRLAKETGGRMFEVSKKQSITQIYAQIQDELRNQYNLGYTPDRKPEDGSDYRHIKLTTNKKDLLVVAREGYYASEQVQTAKD